MGIQGLLPLLKEIQVPRHISDFKGQTLAIDAYVWLHRAAFACAPSLVKSPSTLSPAKFVDYSLHRIRLLRYHGVEAYVVFDGGPLRAKGGTEDGRARRREDHLLKALALEAQGRHKDARDCFTKCVDITPEMALQLIKALKAEGVPYIVAPYEADAQLAYLEREGIVDGIITEDSDLLVFGCKNVIYRLDSNGDCTNISRDRFPACREFSFSGWTDTEFRRMAIMAGCDYLDSIPGIGLKTAHRLLRKHKTVEKVVQNVKLEGSCIVPPDYIAQFRLAELVFLHQRVYDPRSKCLVTLLPLPERGLNEVECGYIGPEMIPDIAQGVAEGRLHPESKLALGDLWPDYHPGANGMAVNPDKTAQVKHEGFYKAKTPLGRSQKQNMSGPLDSFFQRSPATPTTKASTSAGKPFIPAPVGMQTSGSTRLSDLKPVTINAEAGPSRIRAMGTISRVEDSTGDLEVSKFFAAPASRKRSVPRSHVRPADLDIQYMTHDAVPEPIQSLPPTMDDEEVEEGHVFGSDSVPSPVCSTIASPTTSIQHGSQVTSPGISGDEEHHGSRPGSNQERHWASSVSPHLTSPSDGRQRKRRKPSPLDEDTPSPFPDNDMLVPSSSDELVPPRTPEDKAHDFTAFCGVGADDGSSIDEDWHVKEEFSRDTASSEEDKRAEASARATATVAKGWRAKYSFNAKSSPFTPARLPLATPDGRTPLNPCQGNATPLARPSLDRRGSSLKTTSSPKMQDPRNRAIRRGNEENFGSPGCNSDSPRPLLPMSTAMGGLGIGAISSLERPKAVLVHQSPPTPAPAARGSGGSKLQRFKFVPR